jgi:hypothetical protein
MTDEKPAGPEELWDPPHPLDGGLVHGHHVPERLAIEDQLKRIAAAEEHQEVENERGLPPHGKL